MGRGTNHIEEIRVGPASHPDQQTAPRDGQRKNAPVNENAIRHLLRRGIDLHTRGPEPERLTPNLVRNEFEEDIEGDVGQLRGRKDSSRHDLGEA